MAVDFSLIASGKTLIANPTLAKLLSVEEAIILSQIKYWLTSNERREKGFKYKRHYNQDKWWCWNSYDEWNNELPFMSKSTIQRKMGKLEKRGLIIRTCIHKQ